MAYGARIGCGAVLIVCLAAGCSSTEVEPEASSASKIGSCAGTPHDGEAWTDPITGKTVQGVFLEHMSQTGGISGSGRPTTNVFDAVGADGVFYRTQCFERRVFEWHSESEDCNYRVLGRHLGRQELARRYGSSPPEGSPPRDYDIAERDPVTGRFMSFRIAEHWRDTGGLAENGRPITDEIWEQNGDKSYLTQYFERAVFEYHPENARPYDILGRLLGRDDPQCQARIAEEERGNPPPKGPAPGWEPVDHDGCGLDGRPHTDCNAGRILAYIGEHKLDTAFDLAGCGKCVGGLVGGGAAVVAGSGVLTATALMAWSSFNIVDDCRSCINFLRDSGTFAVTSCLVDSFVSDGCELDPTGADNLCKFRCERDHDQYGYMAKYASTCVCTPNPYEAQCRVGCYDGYHVADSSCTCVRD